VRGCKRYKGASEYEPSIDSTTGNASVELLWLTFGLEIKDPFGVKDSRPGSPSLRLMAPSISRPPFDDLVEGAMEQGKRVSENETVC
jgi:hypothetical protein